MPEEYAQKFNAGTRLNSRSDNDYAELVNYLVLSFETCQQPNEICKLVYNKYVLNTMCLHYDQQLLPLIFPPKRVYTEDSAVRVFNLGDGMVLSV